MSRNWKIILALLAFIFAYNHFVLGPYNQKNRPKKVKSTETVKGNPQPANSSEDLSKYDEAEDTTVVTPETAANISASEELSLGSRSRIHKMELGPQEISFYSDGSLGQVRLSEFTERDAKHDPVFIVQEGLHWRSTDPIVSLCLNSLKPISKTDSFLSYEGKSNAGNCALNYKKAENSVLEISLFLKGFAQSQGVIEFKGRSDLGSDNVLEQNKLISYVDASTEIFAGDELFTNELLKGKVSWLSFGNQYFASILIPKGQFNPNIVLGYDSGKEETKKTYYGVQYPLLPAVLQKGATIEMESYFGPKELSLLKDINPTLDEAVDLGWFSSVARFMLWALNAINLLFHNYGVAIIVLTLIVRFLFWPLNKKVFASGQAMKKLQPEMERIRNKYGKDKSRQSEMNMEIMGLYKTHKVNPMGSCFPLLLQMPIFIGLYGALNNSIDLYQEPFLFWIQDLSSADPFYVLPLLWTASLFLTIKLNPQPTQTQPGMPDMKWMMYAMYVFFGYMAKDWPSGLNLYLVVSNVVGIFQQVLFKRSVRLQPAEEGA